MAMSATMFSLTKPFKIKPPIFPATKHRHLHSIILGSIKSSSSSSSSNDNNNATSNSTENASPPVTPPDTVEIRFRRISRKKSRQRQQEDDVANGRLKQVQPSEPKTWESMTLTEKAIELYVGEKGLLFWLNKFAYASIFIIIGGWILFRFVGPALNLYQLDSTPLSPSTMFKG